MPMSNSKVSEYNALPDIFYAVYHCTLEMKVACVFKKNLLRIAKNDFMLGHSLSTLKYMLCASCHQCDREIMYAIQNLVFNLTICQYPGSQVWVALAMER